MKKILFAFCIVVLTLIVPLNRVLADPPLPLLRMPICGDQDGSETPFVLNCPDFTPNVNVQAYRVLGSGTTNLTFDFVFREAIYNNELGYFLVDNFSGSIEGHNPGDSGYITVALQRAKIIFPSGSTAYTPDATVQFNGGDIVVFFIVQDNSLTNLLMSNPTNDLYRSPLAFFSLDRQNPDGIDHFVGFQNEKIGVTQFAFEDLTGGGDRDYDDIVYNITGSLQPVALDDFKQNRNIDGSKVRWADDHLFDITTCGTMEFYGCVITSVTDVLSSYGLKTMPQPDGSSMDPGHLNHYFAQRPGTHSGCNIFWEPAIKSVNYSLLKNDYARNKDGSIATGLTTRIKDIDDALSAGNLVVAGVGGHYVVLYQKASAPAPDGSPDYLIVDPFRHPPYQGPFPGGNWSGKLLSETYGTVNHLESVLQVVVIQNKAPQPGRSWTIVAHSPVELLITDPTGAQTGFNPVTGTYIQDIPESTYGLQQGLLDDTGVLPPPPDVLYFGQNNLSMGKYTVQVIGTGSGPYSLDFGLASGPDDTSLRTVTGVAVPGQTDTYIVIVAEGQPLAITLMVKIDIKPGETPNPVNVKSAGLTPVAIWSTPTFNANTVDPSSIRFGPSGASAVKSSIQDVNADGLPDLLMKFNTQQAGIIVGDTQACLIGKTVNAIEIKGCDQIMAVP